MSTLLQYNREDCLAMKYVEEWLREVSRLRIRGIKIQRVLIQDV